MLFKKTLKTLGSIIILIWLATKLVGIFSGLLTFINATELSDSTAEYALDIANTWELAAEAANANRMGETIYYAGLSDQKHRKLTQIAKDNEVNILNNATSTCNDALNELHGKTISEVANAYEICANAFRDAAGGVSYAKEIPVTPIPLGYTTAGYFRDMANDLILAKESIMRGEEYGYLYYTSLVEQKGDMIKDLANRNESAAIGEAFQVCEEAWRNISAVTDASIRINALDKCIDAYQTAARNVTDAKEVPFTPVPMGAITAGYLQDVANDYAKAAEEAEMGHMESVWYILAVLAEKKAFLVDVMESGEDIYFWSAGRICEKALRDALIDASTKSQSKISNALSICAKAYQDVAGNNAQLKEIPFTPVPLSNSTAQNVLNMADDLMKASEAVLNGDRDKFTYYINSYEQLNSDIYDKLEPGEEVIIRKADMICANAINTLTDDSSASKYSNVLKDCARAYYDAVDMK